MTFPWRLVFFLFINWISCAIFDHTPSDILNPFPHNNFPRDTRSIVVPKDGQTRLNVFLPHPSSGDAKDQWNGHNADLGKEWVAAWSMWSHRKGKIFPWIITIWLKFLLHVISTYLPYATEGKLEEVTFNMFWKPYKYAVCK